MTNLKKIIEEWKEMRVNIGDAFTSNAILKDYKYDDVNMMVQALEEAVAIMSATAEVLEKTGFMLGNESFNTTWLKKWGMK